MTHWQTRSLGECADWLSGGTPSKANPSFWNGSIPWVSAKDMKSFRIRDTEDHISHSAVGRGGKVIPPGTTLLLVRGMTLHNDVPICVAMRDMAFNQDVKAIRAKADVDSEFLAYWFCAHKPALLAAVDHAGHGTGRLLTDLLKKMVVTLPSLPEQKAIAAVLGALDDKIEFNRQMNATLEAMAGRSSKAGSSISTQSAPNSMAASPSASIPRPPLYSLTSSKSQISAQFHKVGVLAKLTTLSHLIVALSTHRSFQTNCSRTTAF